jgi:hypothetical protein
MISDETLDPEPDGAWKDRKRCDGNLARSLTSTAGIRPRKKRHDASGGAFRIAEIEVISGRVVEVDGSLDEPQSEDASVEVEITLWVACYPCDVMDAGSCKSHGNRDIRVSTEVFATEGNAHAVKEESVYE